MEDEEFKPKKEPSFNAILCLLVQMGKFTGFFQSLGIENASNISNFKQLFTILYQIKILRVLIS